MKIIFYGTRDYDHLYFDVLAADPDYGCTIKFLAANLDPDTAQLAAGGDAVCAFVNSDCGAETLSVLAGLQPGSRCRARHGVGPGRKPPHLQGIYQGAQ